MCFTAGLRPNGTYPDGTLIHPDRADSGIIAIVTIGVITITVLLLSAVSISELFFKDKILIQNLSTQLVFILYKHYLHRNLTSINFDNPVYRKTTEDQFSLEKNMPPRMYPSTINEEVRALARDCQVSIR